LKNSLNSNDISQLLKTSQLIHSPNFKFRAIPSDDLKVGFSIKRCFGSAVLRNCFKRKVRAEARFLSKKHSPLKILIIIEKNIKKVLNTKNELTVIFKTTSESQT